MTTTGGGATGDGKQATGGLPTYVERGGEVVYSPPGVANGVQMYAFMLRADVDRMQLMYDRYLNGPSGGAVQYEPAGSIIVLNFTSLARVGALTPPDVERGYFAESEVAIWTLAYDRVSGEYATFVPYMVVDRGSAMAMGREVYGFPKQLGQVTMPSLDEPTTTFALEVDAVRNWGPGEPFEQQRLITITSSNDTAPPPESDFVSQQHLVGAMAALIGEDSGLLSRIAGGPDQLDHAANAVELLAQQRLPMVFLKQIRDGHMPLQACYQAVQTAEFVVTGFRGAGQLPGSFVVDIAEFANEPIRRDLGLPAGPIDPVGAFWVDFDFTLSTAQVVWASNAATVTVRSRIPS